MAVAEVSQPAMREKVESSWRHRLASAPVHVFLAFVGILWLIPAVGLESSHLSQQLAVLRRARVVNAVRSGSSVTYSIADPAIVDLLAAARSFLINSLSVSQGLLADLHQG